MKCKNINEVPLIETKVESQSMKQNRETKFFLLIMKFQYNNVNEPLQSMIELILNKMNENVLVCSN